MDKDKIIIELINKIYTLVQNIDYCSSVADFHLLKDEIYLEIDKLAYFKL